MPRKEFESFTRLDASDVNTYLMDQSVMTFAGTAARGSAITTPVEGMVTYLEDSNSLQLYDGSGWTAAGGVSSGNAIINGAFEINQRQFTSATANNVFTFDRWRQDVSGGTVTTTPQAFTLGAAPVSGYEAANFLRTVVAGQSASSHYAIQNQRIEGVRTYAGQTVTISFFAKAGSGTPKIGVGVAQLFGTGGSPSAAAFAGAGAITISTSWARYSLTYSVPSISGKTIGTNQDDYLSLELWMSGGSDFAARASDIGIQNNTFDIWGVQVEAGSSANPFRRNANSIQGELAACERYYYRSTSVDGDYTRFGQGLSYSSTSASIQVSNPSTMRVPPHSIEFSTLALYDGALVSPTISAIVFDDKTKILNSFSVTTSGLTALRTQQLVSNNTRNAFLGFSAEI